MVFPKEGVEITLCSSGGLAKFSMEHSPHLSADPGRPLKVVRLQTKKTPTWLQQINLLSPVLLSASGWEQQWIWCCKGHNGLAAIGRGKESWKTKVSHQMVSKGPIVLFTRALLPGGEAKKKKYQDKHFLPVMIRSCCLQRSDYTVSQMFKKKTSRQPLSTLTIAAAQLSVSLCTKQSGNIALLFL